MRKIRWLALMLVALSMAACAASSKDGKVRRNPNVLTREELLTSELTNLYDIIERERPRWFQVRTVRSLSGSNAIAVYMNNTPLGGLESLRQMGVEGVEMVRYLDPSQARTSLPSAGVSLASGAIQVITAAGAY